MNTTANWITEPLKKKRGRPKKTENVVKPPKGKRGRPKKIKDNATFLQQFAPKRKRGRPKKVETSNNIELMNILRNYNLAKALQSDGKKHNPSKELRSDEKKEKDYDIYTNRPVDLITVKKSKEKIRTYRITATVTVVEV